jgi:hypothetical protein
MEIWERIFILVLIIVLFLKFTPKEGFYGWIPLSTRSTHNMSYDLRGDPNIYRRQIPFRTKGYLGPFMYGLFPYWHLSPHHPFAYYRSYF